MTVINIIGKAQGVRGGAVLYLTAAAVIHNIGGYFGGRVMGIGILMGPKGVEETRRGVMRSIAG